MRMQRLTPRLCLHLVVGLALLLCYTAAVAAAGKEREQLHHVNEARNFQASRLPRMASSSINEDRYSHRLQMASSSTNLDRISNSLKGKAIPKIQSINYSRKYSRVPVNQNIVSKQEPRLRVYRRRRRKKRPGVFLVPTTVVSSTSFSGVTNFASASLSSSQTSARTFTSTSSESITTTSEKVNKTQAAELMKQQYHKFRSLLPGGKSEDNDTESSGISEDLEQHISRGSFHSRATILNGFKQQRSAGENSGISQSGKLPSSLQAFFPADLLQPITRIPEQSSPENLDANSTGSVDTIARILEERLGPGSSNSYDPSILVDFLALIALTRPALDTRPARGNQIPGVLGLNRRRGGDIAGRRLSQRHASLRPLMLAQQLQVDPTKIQTANTNARIKASATNHFNANTKGKEILRKDGPNTDSEIILGEYRKKVQLKDSNSPEDTKSVDEFAGRASSSIKQEVNFDGVSKSSNKAKSLTESSVPPENTANTLSQLERATPKLEAPLLFSDIEELQKSPESEVEMEIRNGPNLLYQDSLNIEEVNNTADITNSSGPVVTNENSEFGPFSDGNDPNAGVSPPALPPVLRASLYSYLVPRLMSLAPLTETIPGVPGLDYPIMSTLPYTNFYCSNMPWPGFYADTEARCQAWHLCDLDGRQASFLCPNGTIFNQAFMVCDWWYNYDCQEAPYLYPLNERLFQQPELPPPTQQHRTLTAQVLDTLFL